MSEILISIPEAARRFQCSRSKLYRMISEGLIPIVKLGQGRSSAVRIRLADLEEFAAGRAERRGQRA